jgi:hypothetical protein
VDIVAKVSWPEASRENEAEIIEEIREKGKDNEHIQNHLPTVICWADFEGTYTGCIRTALKLDASDSGRRVLRITVFQRLQSILPLNGWIVSAVSQFNYFEPSPFSQGN